MKKTLVLFFTILLVNSTYAVDTSSLMETTNTLINLSIKAKELGIFGAPKLTPQQQIEKVDQEFYENLYKALNKSTFKEIKEALAHIPQRTGSFVANHIIELLLKQSIGSKDNNITIKQGSLVLTLPKIAFTDFILLIARIAETITTLHKPEDTISIFSDNLFSTELLTYLLVSALQNLGYNSIQMNILPIKEGDTTELDKTIKNNLPDLKLKINVFKTIKDFIDSGNKIDIYLTNLTYPKASNAFNCKWENGKYQIFVEQSKSQNLDYLISNKELRMNKKQSLGKAFINLLKHLPNPSELHQEECVTLKNSHTDLADIIYETNKTHGKQIPLFACTFEPTDTGAGKFINVRIIETRLNFNKYSELLSAIFKTNIALQVKNFNAVAQLFELYTQDKNNPKQFVILNDNLDNTPSTIKTFIRRNEKIGPSETIVAD